MSLERSLRGIDKCLMSYGQWLEEVSDEEFLRTPAEGVWSYAEVYAHIFRSNMMCFSIIDRCAKGEGIEYPKPLKLPYRIVLFFRSFPPNMRFRVPEKLTYMVEKISRDEARQLVQDFRHGLKASAELAKKASPTQRLKHPRMGMMNAREWIAFIDTHTRHHLRQLRRIRKMMH